MRTAALACLLPLAFATSAAHAAPAAAPATQVAVVDDELVYMGELDEQASQRLFALYEDRKDKPTTLSILSRGGPVLAGIALGRWVRAHKLDVKVLEYCMSSCANYVFPAGARKIVSNFAVIGFHGGAASTAAMFEQAVKEKPTPELQAVLGDMRRSFARQTQAEQAYLKEIGVRADMVSLGQQERYQQAYRDDPKVVGWTYTLEDFGRMGVHGIEVINPPWQPGSALKKVSFATLKLDD